MNTAWFDVTVAWLPGSLLGAAAGCFGALVAWTRRAGETQPRGQTLLRAAYWSLVCASFLMLTLGAVALAVRQPREVWYALLQPGMLGTCLFGLVAFRAAYPRNLGPSRP